MNKILLHLEGLAVLLFSLYFYSYFQFSWVLFFVLLLAPDVSMMGYLINNKVGAILYNLIHTYTLAILVIICGLLLSSQLVLALGLILSSHIGMDRMVGYGLKYPTNFKDTHLKRV
ncbi:DUF4260 domain-containing protein [Paenibacillus crassostreae]|uniref:DUF4260 domain-containing protein n=2 Tax=Paenibacillus crassostreae TaxID=1763538 RepID=A0A167FE13_9BACL|nr:DUF4260 domain-containing protein [Paenibacillus crassostreae]AOZ90779.1 hypothetical protein LPB68_00210 [Paenibacillus crassostreae]OAB76454.1 hypothetical protein PNBC_03320 [Paenibacillus crassostreae]